MKKRILSLLLAFLMVASIFPAPAYADDSGAESEAIVGDADNNTGKDPSIGRVAKITGAFPILWKDPTTATPANQVNPEVGTMPAYVKIVDVHQFNQYTMLYKLDAAGSDAWPAKYQDYRYMESGNLTFVSKCATCGAYECTTDHTAPSEPSACGTCGIAGCTSAHTNWCAVCKKDDCGTNHDAPPTRVPVTSTGPATTTNQKTAPTIVTLIEKPGLLTAIENPKVSIAGDVVGATAYPAYMEVEAVETVGNVTYYQLKAADGYTWPDYFGDIYEHYWILSTKVTQVQVCPDCGKPGCEETHKPATVPSVSHSSGITVSSDSGIPAGAELKVSVPDIATGASSGIFDIKILKKDGTEWQPIDDGKTVTISIPVNGIPDGGYVDVYHFLDYAPAMGGDIVYWSVDGANETVRAILADAIAASNREGYVALKIDRKNRVSDGMVSIETNSFSAFKWSGSDFDPIEGNEKETTEKFNNGISGASNTGKVTNEYYATKDHLFKLTTTDGVMKDACAFEIRDSITVNSGNVTGTFSTTVQGAYLKDTDGGIFDEHDATVVIPDTAAPGETIVLAFNGGLWTFYLLIHIVENYTVDFQSPLVEATGLPSAVSGVTDGDESKELVTIPAAEPVPVDKHYSFVGWNTQPDGNGISYYGGDKFTPMRDMTLYAMWSSANSIVKFNTNGGTGTYADVTVTTGESIVLPEGPVRQDYQFLGWAASIDGYSTPYAAGASYTVNQDTPLYAIWGVNLTVAVSGGTLTLQKKGDFDTLPLGNHEYVNGQKVFYNEPVTVNGVTSYQVFLLEGFLQNARFTFTYNSNSHNATVSANGADFEAPVNQTGRILLDVTDAGINKNTTITFSAVEKGKVSYTITYDTDFGSAVSPTILQGYSDSRFNIDLPTTTRTGHTFSGWKVTEATGNWELNKVYTDTNPTDVYGNATLTAQWTPLSYTATWDVDGTKTTATYAFGTQIAKPADPTKTGYTFTGWSGYTDGMTMPAGNVTFVAQWEAAPVNYTLEVYKMDLTGKYGSPEKKTLTERTGTEITFTPAPESGFSYDATGNNVLKATVAADGSTVLKVYYSRNQHTITFDSDGGSVVSPVTYYYGAEITQFGISKLEGHTFAAWAFQLEGNWVPVTDGDGKLVLGYTYTMPDQDVAMKAQWTVNSYTATWNVDGETTEESYEYGAQIQLPEEPEKPGYTFTGWSGYTEDMTMPAKNLTFIARWDANTIGYTVEIYEMDVNGNYSTDPNLIIAKSGKMDADVSASHETKEGFTPDTKNSVTSGKITTSGATLKLYYSRNRYTIQFNTDGGNEIADATYYYGARITPPADPVKESSAEFSYAFTGWTPAIPDTMPIGGLNVTAQYEITTRTYTVTWKNADGKVLETDTAAYNTDPTYDGATPTRAATKQYTYTFAGWTPVLAPVTADVTYTATYTETLNHYTVTWVDENGGQLEVDTDVSYGTTPSYDGTVPSKAATDQYTYTFAGWSPAIADVTGDVTYQATFTATLNKYTVTWVDGDGKTIRSEQLEYGATPAYTGNTPGKTATDQYSYTFTGWTPGIEDVTGDATYTAQFKEIVNTYTVTWAYEDGSVYDTATVPYGQPAKNYAPANPTKANSADGQYWYQFAAWVKTQGETDAIGDILVTGNVTYYAYFNEVTMEYDINWYNYNDDLLHTTENIAYGETPEYPSQKNNLLVGPVVNGYTHTFDKWSPAISPVKGNASYSAMYVATPSEYSITYAGTETGKNPTAYTIETANITLINPEKTGYTFTGWTGTGLTEQTMEVTIPKGSTGDRTYTANWEVITYSITYSLNDGTNAAANPATYTVEDEITLEAPAKTGYTFAGWTGTDLAEQTMEVTIPKGSTGNRDYTANWQANTYRVVFDPNGGTGTMEDQSLTYDTTALLTANGFTRTGFTFVGWMTQADGTETAYTDQQQVKNLRTEANGTITLYARWQINTVSLTIKTHSADPDQNHVFQVEGTTLDGRTVKLTVAMDANGEKKIVNLPAGRYTIGNEAQWSWRYAAQSVTQDVHTNEVEDFNYNYVAIASGKSRWLNDYGYASAEN